MKKDSLWKALGLSFGVAVIGAVLWGVLYTAGWFVGLVAYFVSFGMIKVFNKYYSKDCNWKYVYILASIIVLNIVSSFISLAVYCANVLEISFGVALEALVQTFSQYAGEFIMDMVIGCVCAVFGVVTVIQIDKRNKANETAVAKQQASVNAQTTKPVEVEVTEVKTENKAIYCSACGSKLEANSTKCPSCGKDVE